MLGARTGQTVQAANVSGREPASPASTGSSPGREGRGLHRGGSTLAGLVSVAGQSASPSPIAFSVPTPTPSSMTCRIVSYRRSKCSTRVVGPFAFAAASTTLLELLEIHGPSLLTGFSLPLLLIQPISRPFLITTLMRVLSHSPTPFEFRGYPEFSAHALSFMVVRA